VDAPTAGKSNWIGGICVAPNHEASDGTVNLAHPDAAAASSPLMQAMRK
jgi:hypothetical protein